MEDEVQKALEGYLEVLSLSDQHAIEWTAEDLCAAFEWSKTVERITGNTLHADHLQNAIKAVTPALPPTLLLHFDHILQSPIHFMLEWLLRRSQYHRNNKGWALSVLASFLTTCSLSANSEKHVIDAITSIRQPSSYIFREIQSNSHTTLANSTTPADYYHYTRHDITAAAFLLRYRLENSKGTRTELDIKNMLGDHLQKEMFQKNKSDAMLIVAFVELLATTLLLPPHQSTSMSTHPSSTSTLPSRRNTEKNQINAEERKQELNSRKNQELKWRVSIENELKNVFDMYSDTLLENIDLDVLLETSRVSFSFAIVYAHALQKVLNTSSSGNGVVRNKVKRHVDELFDEKNEIGCSATKKLLQSILAVHK